VGQRCSGVDSENSHVVGLSGRIDTASRTGRSVGGGRGPNRRQIGAQTLALVAHGVELRALLVVCASHLEDRFFIHKCRTKMSQFFGIVQKAQAGEPTNATREKTAATTDLFDLRRMSRRHSLLLVLQRFADFRSFLLHTLQKVVAIEIQFCSFAVSAKHAFIQIAANSEIPYLF
jgi:hypothetical protein